MRLLHYSEELGNLLAQVSARPNKRSLCTQEVRSPSGRRMKSQGHRMLQAEREKTMKSPQKAKLVQKKERSKEPTEPSPKEWPAVPPDGTSLQTKGTDRHTDRLSLKRSRGEEQEEVSFLSPADGNDVCIPSSQRVPGGIAVVSDEGESEEAPTASRACDAFLKDDHHSRRVRRRAGSSPPAVTNQGSHLWMSENEAIQQTRAGAVRDDTPRAAHSDTTTAAVQYPVTPPLRAAVSPCSLRLEKMQLGEVISAGSQETVISPLPPPARLCSPGASQPGVDYSVACDDNAGGEKENSDADTREESNWERDDRVYDEWESNLSSHPSSPLRILAQDTSGFTNTGNDCYACSVVTMLIRNRVFMDALLSSLPHSAREIIEEQVKKLKKLKRLRDAEMDRKLREISDKELQCGELMQGFPLHMGFAQCYVELKKHRFLVTETHSLQREMRNSYSDRVAHYLNMLKRLLGIHSVAAPPDTLGHSDDFSAYVSSRPFFEFQKGVSLAPIRSGFPPDSIFFSGYQEDAHEFLIDLLDRLEKEAVGLRREMSGGDVRESPSPSAAWINEVMQGQLLNVVRCRNPHCGHEIVTVETFLNLGLALAQKNNSNDDDPHYREDRVPVSIQDLIGNIMHFQLLEEYVCDACRGASCSYQGACFFGRPPPLLTIQLKRFDAVYDSVHQTMLMTKNQQPVRISERVEVYSLPDDPVNIARDSESPLLHSYYDSDSKRLSDVFYAAEASRHRCPERAVVQGRRASYRLQGIVHHHGKDIEHGHYTCSFSLNKHAGRGLSSESLVPSSGEAVHQGSDGAEEDHANWKDVDDRHVSRISHSAVENMLSWSTGCYLLLYERERVEEVCECPLDRVMSPLGGPTR